METTASILSEMVAVGDRRSFAMLSSNSMPSARVVRACAASGKVFAPPCLHNASSGGAEEDVCVEL